MFRLPDLMPLKGARRQPPLQWSILTAVCLSCRLLLRPSKPCCSARTMKLPRLRTATTISNWYSRLMHRYRCTLEDLEHGRVHPGEVLLIPAFLSTSPLQADRLHQRWLVLRLHLHKLHLILAGTLYGGAIERFHQTGNHGRLLLNHAATEVWRHTNALGEHGTLHDLRIIRQPCWRWSAAPACRRTNGWYRASAAPTVKSRSAMPSTNWSRPTRPTTGRWTGWRSTFTCPSRPSAAPSAKPRPAVPSLAARQENPAGLPVPAAVRPVGPDHCRPAGILVSHLLHQSVQEACRSYPQQLSPATRACAATGTQPDPVLSLIQSTMCTELSC